jgi:hypothetical protein
MASERKDLDRMCRPGGPSVARRALFATLAAAICLAIPGITQAQDVADFYRDKQIRIIVSTAARGDYPAVTMMPGPD